MDSLFAAPHSGTSSSATPPGLPAICSTSKVACLASKASPGTLGAAAAHSDSFAVKAAAGGPKAASDARKQQFAGSSSKADALGSGRLPQTRKLQEHVGVSGADGAKGSDAWIAGVPEVLLAGEVRHQQVHVIFFCPGTLLTIPCWSPRHDLCIAPSVMLSAALARSLYYLCPHLGASAALRGRSLSPKHGGFHMQPPLPTGWRTFHAALLLKIRLCWTPVFLSHTSHACAAQAMSIASLGIGSMLYAQYLYSLVRGSCTKIKLA